MSRIGVDVDGVLADFNAAFIPHMAKIAGRNLFPEGYQPHTWNYPESMGYTGKEVDAAWTDIKQSADFWQNLLPYYSEHIPLVLEALRVRQHYGDEVYFITARLGIKPKLQTETWLNRMGFPRPTVLISADKGGCAKALDLNYYVDDRHTNCDAVDDAQPDCETFLVDRPWNWGFNSADHRVKSAYEFIHALPPTGA